MIKKFKKILDKLRTSLRLPRIRSKKNSLRVLPELSEITIPAMEELTDRLIAETAGDGGELDREFQRRIAAYDPEVNPISRKQAEILLNSLLKTAISRRKLLNERIARSIEGGRLFDQYYDRIHAVSALAVDAHTKMQQMDVAEENMRYHYDMLLNVRNNSYRKDVRPDMEAWEEIPKRHRDILMAIDEAGGCGNGG